MPTPSVTLHPVCEPGDVRPLLEQNGLPTADLAASSVELFEAEADGRCVGLDGLELYGTVALLRSVVVPSSVRGEGYGAAISDALESRARESDVETLYLLTTTASEFFGARGFEPVAASRGA